MHKNLKILIKNTTEVFSSDLLNNIGKKTGFIIRKGKIDCKSFLSLNTFLGNDICENSLATISSKLANHYGINISPQALNERFNNNAVDFMQEVLKTLLRKQCSALDNEN